jgi:hypothetical protein
MNTEALFLFLILLLGLVLCSFLGGNCKTEGFDSISGMFDAGANALDSAVSDTANAVGSVVGTTSNAVGSVVSGTENAFGSVVSGTENAFGSVSNSVANSYDNYNHYSGTGSSSQLQNGMVFTDASGDTVTVITNSDGTQSLQMLQVGQTTPMVLSSTPPSNYTGTATANTFYAPFGNITATVITGSNGQAAIQFNLPNGQSVVFLQPSGSSSGTNNSLTSAQYYGSTGYPIQQAGYSLAYNGPYGGNAGAVTGPNGNTAYYAQGPNGNTVAGLNQPYGGNAGYAQGPYGNTAYYAQGPYGNTVAGTSSNNGYGNSYYSTMPQGIPASQIPPGQEDLYILKSEVVPPVCPACPSSASCPRQEKCPPCPACARCPEPSFECKKVPNYNAINDEYLPQPVVNSFSQFGM